MKIKLLIMTFLLTTGLIFAPQAEAKKVTIRMVLPQVSDIESYHFVRIFIEKVNAAAPDRLYLKVLGGPEVIPPFEQMGALKRGAIDMLVSYPTFYGGVLPEALGIQLMSAHAKAPEVRKRGMVALQDKIHRQKLNVAFLGTVWVGDHHVLLLKKPIDRADLTGLKIRGVTIHFPTIKVLGGSIITVPMGDLYMALESGLADGTMVPHSLAVDYKLHEVTKYFYSIRSITTLGNVTARAEFWDKVPADLQKMITDILIEIEADVDDWFLALEKRVLSELVNKYGMKEIILPQAETKKLMTLSRDATWKELIEEKVDPKWLSQITDIAKSVMK